MSHLKKLHKRLLKVKKRKKSHLRIYPSEALSLKLEQVEQKEDVPEDEQAAR